MKYLLIYSLLLTLAAGSASLKTPAQEPPQTRSITSDDFSSRRSGNRPVDSSSNQRAKGANRAATYKLVSRGKKFARQRAGRVGSPQSSKTGRTFEVGVTMWKLRPSRSSDNGFKLPVRVGSRREMWTAERVNAETSFRTGDRLRLAVESSVPGYLYIVDSELFSDGRVGMPVLIFPETEKIDNAVKPGVLVDIPDQNEDLPYFLIDPKNSDYSGELLTIIISPKPLPFLKTDREGRLQSLEDLAKLEDGAEAEIYNRSDWQDKIYTLFEAESACGGKTRQLTREKSADRPCGAATRQLTREDPLPQTIYRIKAAAGQPIVAFVPILVKQ